MITFLKIIAWVSTTGALIYCLIAHNWVALTVAVIMLLGTALHVSINKK